MRAAQGPREQSQGVPAPGPQPQGGVLGHAKLLAEQGRYAEAEAIYRRYIADNPNDPSGYFAVGLLYELLWNNSGSEEMLKKAVPLRPAQRPLLQRAGADLLEAGQVRRGGRGAASVYRVEPQSRRDLGRSGLLPREAGPERRGRGLPAQGGGVESDQSSHLRALRRFLRAPGEGSRARGTAHRRLAASAHQRHHRGPPRAVLVAAGRWGEGRALVSQGRRPAGPARLSEHPRQLPASRAGADRAGHSPGVRAVPGPERGAATGSLRIRERPRLRRQREGVPPSSGDLALRGHLLGRLLRRFRALHAQGQPHPWPRTSPRPSWRWSCRAEPAAAPAFRRRHAGRPWAWPRNASDGLIAAAAAAPGRPSHRAAGYGAAPASCEWLWGTPPRRWRAVRCSPRASDRRARRTRP